MSVESRRKALYERFNEVHERQPDPTEEILLDFIVDIGPAYDRHTTGTMS
jgi:hypothetical protein